MNGFLRKRGQLDLVAFVGFLILVATALLTAAHDQPAKTEKPKSAIHDHGEHATEPRSPMWAKVRAEHLRTHPECAACGQTDSLQVHHIVPFSFDASKELDPKNLITLCVDGVGHTDCHLMFGHGGNFKCQNPKVVEDAKRFREMMKNRVCDPVKPK